MAQISMEMIKELREKTQVGMMDCKKALEEAAGDLDKAVEILRKKGAAVAAKRAENTTNNGRVEASVASDHHAGALVAIACETDFSANTDAMQKFVKSLADYVVKNDPQDVDALLAGKICDTGLSGKDMLDELCAKICENIKVSVFARFQATNGVVNAYIHPGATVGTLIELATDKPVTDATRDQLVQLAKDLCMHVAVTNPVCIDPSGLSADLVEREKTIAREQLVGSNKPANVVEKIVEGKLQKYYQDACLINQAFIKNDKSTVQQHVAEVGKQLGLQISVANFRRFGIGR